MSAPSTRRSARLLAVLAAVPATLVLTALPAAAVPDAGEPVPVEQPLVRWGWAAGDGPAYPGQRFGIGLAPADRGPVLEFLDR